MSLGSKMACPGYVILNLLRVANIICLLLTAVASWIILVMIIKTNNFFFFDAVSHLIVSLVSLFLILSELALFERYFAKHWPLLSPESGLVFLGISMIMLGSGILSHLDEAAISIENLGLPMWRVVISSGILSLVFGLLNIIATYIFCDGGQGITGRQVRIHGTTVKAKGLETLRSLSISSSSMRRPSSPVLPRFIMPAQDRRKTRFHLPISVNYPPSRPLSILNSRASIHTFGSPDRSEENLTQLDKPLPALQIKPPPIDALLNPTPHTHHPGALSVSSKYSEVSNMTRF